MDNGIRYFVIVRGHDEDAFGRIKTGGDGINHAGADEIGNEGIHGAVPAEHKSGSTQDEEIEEHNDFPYGKRGPVIHPDGHDFRTVRGAAALNDNAYADADDDAAENGGQERVRSGRFQLFKPGGAEGKDHDGIGGRCRQPGSQSPVSQVKERKVQNHNEQGKGYARQSLHQKGNTGNAAVDDVVGDKKQVQSGGVNHGSHRKPQYFSKNRQQVYIPSCHSHSLHDDTKKPRSMPRIHFYGGRDGIRTHEPLTKLTVFKTASINRSDTLP